MKDKELTQVKILEAVDSIIANDGFERIGVNAIAQKAGVSKMLIYRYFGGLDELIAQYLLRKDYWANTDMHMIDGADVAGSLKRMFREQIVQLRNDVTLRRLCRWELTADNENTQQLRDSRARNGCELIKAVSGFTHSSHTEVAALATILSAAISYLVLIEDQSPTYNGINLQSDEGWEQIIKGIDLIIDLWIKQV
ncbi:TetR/AcrR family transcriptional regulator [Hoylesella loescheii]|uniref:TetR/AcrR family transcriptional regulator n=1 Tax=Hoylesella loescheii TaxID=840 RepID=UPI00248E52C3|nr:TetR/AcrR family transcriptional regulator [Hoylesella loescheii]